jgi:membrane glycosyltransferase
MALLEFSLAVLLLPKLFGLLNRMLERKIRLGSGGALALINSVIWETLFSALIAPILMLNQTHLLIDILRGRDTLVGSAPGRQTRPAERCDQGNMRIV